MALTIIDLSTMKTSQHSILIGCGILKNELRYLAQKHRWLIEMRFLPSSLHTDLDKLEQSLTRQLRQADESRTLVIYGTCHPLMDVILKPHNAIRVPTQNCIELLLGKDAFTEALAAGAFFLMEDWARRWAQITTDVFGSKPAPMIEIFHTAHTHLLALNTPCSSDFTEAALRIATSIRLPLKWREVSLDRLEHSIAPFIESEGDAG